MRKYFGTKENIELIDEGAVTSVLKFLGKVALGSLISYAVIFVLVVFIICGIHKTEEKEVKKFIEKHPQVKRAIEAVIRKAKDILSKNIKDDAFEIEGHSSNFSSSDFKLKNNTYSTNIGRYNFYNIYEKTKIDYDDRGEYFCSGLNTDEEKEFANSVINNYNNFKNAILEINKNLRVIPNGDIVQFEIDDSLGEPNIDSEDHEFNCPIEVTLDIMIKFVSPNSLEQTSEVLQAKEKLKKQFGKITESTDMEEVYKTITESFDGIEPINEIFGLSEKEKEQKHKLSDIEFGYDKKFNAFCLTVSGYSIDKLEKTLAKKQDELMAAIDEKQQAENKQGRLEAQLKIDYLTNICNKCIAMIKKKKSYK